MLIVQEFCTEHSRNHAVMGTACRRMRQWRVPYLLRVDTLLQKQGSSHLYSLEDGSIVWRRQDIVDFVWRQINFGLQSYLRCQKMCSLQNNSHIFSPRQGLGGLCFKGKEWRVHE